jgi:hypothetical protein
MRASDSQPSGCTVSTVRIGLPERRWTSQITAVLVTLGRCGGVVRPSGRSERAAGFRGFDGGAAQAQRARSVADGGVRSASPETFTLAEEAIVRTRFPELDTALGGGFPRGVIVTLESRRVRTLGRRGVSARAGDGRTAGGGSASSSKCPTVRRARSTRRRSPQLASLPNDCSSSECTIATASRGGPTSTLQR